LCADCHKYGGAGEAVKVCYFPCNIDAAGMLRCLIPGRELRRRYGWKTGMAPHRQQQGVDPERNKPFLTTQFLLDKLPADCDIYVFQMPLEQEYLAVIKAVQAAGKTAVCEADDMHIGIPPYNPASRGTDPKLNPQRNRDWLFQCYRQAGVMSCATPYIAEVYSKFCDTTVIPNYLDWEMWQDTIPCYDVERRRVRVGWMGDSHWRRGDLQVLRGLIGPWLQRHPDVEFVAAGDPSVHDLLEVPEGQRVSVQDTEFRHMDLADITATMDIGLVPLEMNNFNEAKSHLKGLEYAACGIPCVASPTGSYRSWAEAGDGTFLAARPKDWLRALDELVGDDHARRELGRRARQHAQQNTIQEHVNEWADFYTSVSSHTVAAREKVAA
jgi:glycosyltransferase involved in cell wall biosynthesis